MVANQLQNKVPNNNQAHLKLINPLMNNLPNPNNLLHLLLQQPLKLHNHKKTKQVTFGVLMPMLLAMQKLEQLLTRKLNVLKTMALSNLQLTNPSLH